MANNNFIILFGRKTATCYGATLWPTSAIGSSTIVKVYRGGSYGLSSSGRCAVVCVRSRLSLSLFHADASPSVALIFLHSISLCSKSLLLYTSYYYYVLYPYPPPQNIQIYIYIYAVVVVAARVCFYRKLRNINNNNNDTYICVKHILYIISVCVWGVPWRDVLPPP